MIKTVPSSTIFHISHGCAGHVFEELGAIIQAPDLMTAKQLGLLSSPDWATDLYVEQITAEDVSELQACIDDAKASALET